MTATEGVPSGRFRIVGISTSCDDIREFMEKTITSLRLFERHPSGGAPPACVKLVGSPSVLTDDDQDFLEKWCCLYNRRIMVFLLGQEQRLYALGGTHASAVLHFIFTGEEEG